MNAETPSLREIFEAALELPPAERGSYLDEHCANIPGLRAQIDKMLAADAEGKATLEKQASDLASALIPPAPPALPAGSCVGSFVVLDIIGQGGYSTVFRAERTLAGVRQEVALKILDRPLYTADAQRQFRRERQALLHLRDPGIARLIEGGVTEAGLAYIALELIDGAPITEFARSNRLDLHARLRLVIAVCRAVEAAHRALIVHRDLKPGNVLVTNDGEVKLLDFGIAKLLDAENETQTRLPVFTPAYAAPEQRENGPITTATDVYALGVLLGELITGERLNDGSGRTPSGQVSENHDPGVLPASAAATRRQLRGDLDNIVLKAIAAEPAQRYPSAGALADDIQRLLDGLPVSAHPPSKWYRARKFVTRHKGGVASTVAFLLAIFAALGIALWQADVARQEALRANASRDFLVRLFEVSDIGRPREEVPSTQTLLHDASGRIARELGATPELRTEMATVIGRIEFHLGLLDEAEPLLAGAARDADRLFARNDPRWLDAQANYGEVLTARGRYPDAIAQLRRGVDGATTRMPTTNLVHAMLSLAEVQSMADDIKGAEETTRAARQRVQAAGADAGLDYLILKRESENAVRARNFKQGLQLKQATLAAAQNIYGENHVETLEAKFGVAEVLTDTGDYAQAEKIARDCVALYDRIYPAPTDFLLDLLSVLGAAQNYQNHLDDAQVTFERAVKLIRNDLPRSPFAGIMLHNLATIRYKRSEFDQAAALIEEGIAITRKNLGENHSEVARSLRLLGQIHAAQDRADDAIADFKHSSAILQATTGADDPTIASNTVAIAGVELKRGDAAAALVLVDQALPALRSTRGDGHFLTMEARVTKVRALINLGRAGEALDDLTMLETQARSGGDAQRNLLAPVLTERGRAALALHDRPKAEAALREALNLYETGSVPKEEETKKVRDLLVRAQGI